MKKMNETTVDVLERQTHLEHLAPGPGVGQQRRRNGSRICMHNRYPPVENRFIVGERCSRLELGCESRVEDPFRVVGLRQLSFTT